MYNEIDANKPTCKKYLEKAKEFVAKYNELNNVSDITEDSPYYKLLSRLSNDYNNFKNYFDCSDIPSISPINTIQNPAQSSEPSSNITLSGSALVNKLIIVLSILVAIPICLGISYKYSLFGFRKKCKKIKKKINIRLEE
ncbi:Plasmodium variant antigen protein Cir/Yir/Bir, putative [Plasmodium berghei]|uniref:Plasmodium variant antigen protein Cir/Yir/Bir, putative n=1 Tax=Plasmodium berghei TaxID=5821 RepID=A0A0Y9Q0H3_PLABE|nr:Plasmodium variant antigen protein Cir/Yir/Bir, putative [Plasmodium berghei]